MQLFRNPAEAEKQGRMIIGDYIYYRARANIYSALPHEDMAKVVGKTIEVKWHDSNHTLVAPVRAAGYDDTGGCFPCVILEDGTALCVSDLLIKEWKTL